MSDCLEHIKKYMSEYPDIAFDLAKKYWPGALTIGVPVQDTQTIIDNRAFCVIIMIIIIGVKIENRKIKYSYIFASQTGNI